MADQDLVERFYQAFAKKDAEAMAACYADEAEFSDPAFPHLNADEVRGMWRMLCGRSQDLRIEYVSRQTSLGCYQVDWQAWYTFTKTGRPVHNRVQASLQLKNGKIVHHQDRFNFWRWSRQAFGLPGWILGWTPILRKAVQAEAGKALQTFLKKRA